MHPSELLSIIEAGISKRLEIMKYDLYSRFAESPIQQVYANYFLNKLKYLLRQQIKLGDQAFNQENINELLALLKNNDDMTFDTDASYIYSQAGLHNLAVKELAKVLGSVLGIDFIKIIYPRLQALSMVERLELLMLSEDRKRIIDVKACLKAAEESDGVLRHTSELPNEANTLSDREVECLVNIDQHNPIQIIWPYWRDIQAKAILQKGLNLEEILYRFTRRIGASLDSDDHTALYEFLEWYNTLEKDEKNLLSGKEKYDFLCEEVQKKGEIPDVNFLSFVCDFLRNESHLSHIYPKTKYIPTDDLKIREERLLHSSMAMDHFLAEFVNIHANAGDFRLSLRIANLKDFAWHVDKSQWMIWFTYYLKTLPETQRLTVAKDNIKIIRAFNLSPSEIDKISDCLESKDRLSFTQVTSIDKSTLSMNSIFTAPDCQLTSLAEEQPKAAFKPN